MDYRIEKPGAIKVICKREHVHKPESGAGTPDITSFWRKCGQDGTMQKICGSLLMERPRRGGEGRSSEGKENMEKWGDL